MNTYICPYCGEKVGEKEYTECLIVIHVGDDILASQQGYKYNCSDCNWEFVVIH